jgi:hypothetical protein
MNEKFFLDNLTLIDCYLYAACGVKAIIENGVVTGFSPEEKEDDGE